MTKPNTGLVDLEAIAQEAADEYGMAAQEGADDLSLERLRDRMDEATENYLTALQADLTDEALAQQITRREIAEANAAAPVGIDGIDLEAFPY